MEASILPEFKKIPETITEDKTTTKFIICWTMIIICVFLFLPEDDKSNSENSLLNMTDEDMWLRKGMDEDGSFRQVYIQE